MEARPSKEKTESVDEEGKKTTYSILNPLAPEFVPRARRKMALPVEVLVKIFNFLPNHEIRCRISLVCKTFYEICQDESLVPVKDLCIYGHPVGCKRNRKSKKKGKQSYSLRNIEAVSDTITQSKNLTFLKIKALNPETSNELVSIALQACPKLTHLEIIETTKQIGECFVLM